MSYHFSDFCVCPECYADLVESQTSLRCSACGKIYEIRNGIAILLPNYVDDREQRYFENYQHIAQDDLKEPFEPNRAYRYKELLDFIGRHRLRGKRFLDIGPGAATYLLEIEAELVVALDIAYAYLEHIPSSDKIARVCGDAERLPFKRNFFDFVSLVGVLEHVLHPELLIERLLQTCRDDTAVFVEVPWEESLEMYQNSKYEFTHLRSFNNYSFRTLWYQFYINRYKVSYPNLTYPLVFSLEGKIPFFLYNALIRTYYFNPGWKQKEYEWRIKLGQEFPKNVWWLRWFTKPLFRIYEMSYGKPPLGSRLHSVIQAIQCKASSAVLKLERHQ